MEDSIDKTPFETIIELLTEHEVEFIVIGGQAETLHGSARVTFDIDLCYRRTGENLRRLADVLAGLNPKLRDAPEDLPFRIDAESLALGSNFTLRTSVGDLDLLGHVEPLGGFERLAERAEHMRIGSVDVRVIHLDDLITIKQHLGRPKDRDSLMHLRAIQRVREHDSETG